MTDEMTDNARLIAAAPTMAAELKDKDALIAELVKALVQARGALLLDAMVDDDGEAFGTTKVALDAIGAAIAKARQA